MLATKYQLFFNHSKFSEKSKLFYESFCWRNYIYRQPKHTQTECTSELHLMISFFKFFRLASWGFLWVKKWSREYTFKGYPVMAYHCLLSSINNLSKQENLKTLFSSIFILANMCFIVFIKINSSLLEVKL